MKTFLSLMLIAVCGLPGTTAAGQNALPDIPVKAIPDSIVNGNEAVGNGKTPDSPSLPSIAGQELSPKNSLIDSRISGTQPSLSSPYPTQLQPFTISVPTDGRIAVWNSGG
ncbi:MAG: hypothetical protein K2F76_00735, partial [Duncaniella dubosii]|nr:hypothetical protein [Duncaniella dubosii]